MKCDEIIERYLLSKNPLNHYKYLIALFLSILMFIYVINVYDFNQYMEQIIIPILTFVVIIILIDLFTKLTIDKVQKDRLTKMCHLWLNDPNTQKDSRFRDSNGLLFINMSAVENYNGMIEGFEQKDNCQTHPDNQEKIEENKDLNKENEDFTSTVFNSNVPEPHNNEDEIHHILESGDNLLRNKAPFGSESVDINNDESCLFGTSCGAICSTKNTKAPCVAPIPGPQWQPQTALSVEKRLMNKNYTKNTCLS